MDRGTRRERKARIRARLLRAYQQKARRLRYASWMVTPAPNPNWKRRLFKNERKPSPRVYPCGDTFCDWCIGSKTYRQHRELERMHQELRAWQAGENISVPIEETAEATQGHILSEQQRTQTADKQRRRDPRFCPVCLRRVARTALGNRWMWRCLHCHAVAIQSAQCRICGKAGVWINRQEAACRACARHGSKSEIVAAKPAE